LLLLSKVAGSTCARSTSNRELDVRPRPHFYLAAYCLKTNGGPLTRFPLRSTVTSTRSAILMKGMPLFIPYVGISGGSRSAERSGGGLGKFTIAGRVVDSSGNGVADVELQVGKQTVYTGATGVWGVSDRITVIETTAGRQWFREYPGSYTICRSRPAQLTS
jgi:hypothetical protein